jgi:hypothetical protein
MNLPLRSERRDNVVDLAAYKAARAHESGRPDESAGVRRLPPRPAPTPRELAHWQQMLRHLATCRP